MLHAVVCGEEELFESLFLFFVLPLFRFILLFVADLHKEDFGKLRLGPFEFVDRIRYFIRFLDQNRIYPPLFIIRTQFEYQK